MRKYTEPDLYAVRFDVSDKVAYDFELKWGDGNDGGGSGSGWGDGGGGDIGGLAASGTGSVKTSVNWC